MTGTPALQIVETLASSTPLSCCRPGLISRNGMLHAAEQRVPLRGASDHLVSEAIYLSDPEGNGIEIYHDWPSETWTWHDGMIRMETQPLDLHALAASVQARNWSGLPDGSHIGHVHLQVGELSSAENFYSGLLGLDVVSRSSGATFLSSGSYHHHLATNTWNSRGAGVRSQPMTGLADVELVAEAAVFDAVRSRLTPEQTADSSATHLSLSDPWGTKITLVRG